MYNLPYLSSVTATTLFALVSSTSVPSVYLCTTVLNVGPFLQNIQKSSTFLLFTIDLTMLEPNNKYSIAAFDAAYPPRVPMLG